VSAAIAPKDPDEAAEPVGPDDEGWALLENLRRRLEEQGAQARRTQQQVTQLAESIGALVEAQRRRSRWLNLNSFVAYLIFTMLCGAGFYLLYQSRAGALAREHAAAQHEREQAVRKADEAAARAAAREQADNRAWEVYQLLEGGKRAEAEAKLAAFGELPMSRTERAILAARVHETKVMAFEAALKGAAASLKAGRHAEVIAPLEAALVSEPTGARAVLARYYLGVAYAKASQLDKAIAHLQAAVDGDTDQEDARFQLASALDRSGAFAQARAEYDRYATAHPQSPWAVFAMRRSATLALMPPVAPAAAPVPGTAPAPGAAPAPAPGAPAFRPAPPSFTPPPAGAAAPWRPAPAPAVAPPPRAPVPAPKAPASAAGAAPPGAGTPPSPPASALSQPSEAPSPPSQQQPPPAPTP
jgi:tetratricopeptide (TPR) repeat protein